MIGYSYLPMAPLGDHTSLKWPIICFAFGLQSMVSFINTIVPDRRPERYNDASLFLDSLNATGQLRSEEPITWISALASWQVRPRDIPEWLVAAARDRPLPESHSGYYLDSIDLARTFDAKDFDAKLAREKLDAFKAENGITEQLAAYDAWVAAIYENEPEEARFILEARPDIERAPTMMLAARAAIAAREGDFANAKTELANLERMLATNQLFRSPSWRMIRRQIERLIKQPRHSTP
jgi:hypothetical protein